MSERIEQPFQEAVQEYARQHEIPVVHFDGRERKDDLAQACRSKFSQAEGVVFIGTALERARSFKSTKDSERASGAIRGVAAVGAGQPLLFLLAGR